jgi:hypothetical protein
MERGAEAYLQSWERVDGVRFGCKSGRQRARRGGMGHIRLGDSAEALLRRAGQPRVRGNRAWSWCARGKKNRGRRIAAVLTPDGSVALAGSSAKGSEARRIRVGDPAARLEGSARKIGKALFVRRAGPGTRLVYGVRKGRVRYVAVGTGEATGSRKSLRRYLGLAKLR